jgi:hypothetical protein
MVLSFPFGIFSKYFQRLTDVCRPYLKNGIDNAFDSSRYPLIIEFIDKEMHYAEKDNWHELSDCLTCNENSITLWD